MGGVGVEKSGAGHRYRLLISIYSGRVEGFAGGARNCFVLRGKELRSRGDW